MTRNTATEMKLAADSPLSDPAREGCDLPEELFHLSLDTAPDCCKPSEFDKAAGSVKPTIRRIPPPELPACDPLSKLRQSFLGRFYIRYLKKNKMIRAAAFRLWCSGYPIYIKYKIRTTKTSRSFPLVKLSKFSRRSPENVYKLAASETVESPLPAVYPGRDRSHLATLHDQYTFPSIFITTIHNAFVTGGTNLIVAGDEVICHDLYDFPRDYTSEELHGRTVINPRFNRVRWLMNDPMSESLPAAAAFIDACAHNYAHWMTEVLPRICLFCVDERFQDVPIILSDDLHSNLMESLLMVSDAQRTIFTLPVGRAVHVEKLFSVSPTGYVPFGQRSKKLLGHLHGLFSPYALNMLCNKLKAMVPLAAENIPSKIYLRRNSGIRKIVNNAEIESILTRKGFSIVEPEKLNFLEQIILFANTDVVVGGTGAACANLVFCKPSAQFLILISKHESMPYGYWQNMACAVGGRVKYVLGDVVHSADLGIHGDYTINPSDILDALNMPNTPAEYSA